MKCEFCERETCGRVGGGLPKCKGYYALRAANAARQAEWDPEGKITPEFRGLELAGEVGELCNILKKLVRERLGLRGSRTTKEKLAEELADVVMCTDLVAADFGIDLDKAVREKFNKTSEALGLSIFMVTGSHS
jgi:NTP pyrophosphatase (non-canonical NTP hydrolase)